MSTSNAMNTFGSSTRFDLEGGDFLDGLKIAYHTYGELAPSGTNVIWICHPLTGNSDVMSWWGELVGPGLAIDTDRFFVVCANVIGSCYGSSEPSYSSFPLVSIRDQVRAFTQLREYLGVSRIACLIGGSMGGQHVMEWALVEPDVIERIIPIATNAKQSAWAVAFNAAQRLAITADPTFYTNVPGGGAAGLIAARAVGMLSYRTPVLYNVGQGVDDQRLQNFPVETYLYYQGAKLRKRFSAYSYYALTRSMDSHDVGRGRGSTGEALRSIRAKALVVGVDTDMLFPESEQQYIADMIGGATYRRMTSVSGHDAFLIQQKALGTIIQQARILP